MKILTASSEVFPYSKTGGLADMVGSLAKYLAAAAHEVVIVTPLYRGISDKVARASRRSVRSNCRWGWRRSKRTC